MVTGGERGHVMQVARSDSGSPPTVVARISTHTSHGDPIPNDSALRSPADGPFVSAPTAVAEGPAELHTAITTIVLWLPIGPNKDPEEETSVGGSVEAPVALPLGTRILEMLNVRGHSPSKAPRGP